MPLNYTKCDFSTMIKYKLIYLRYNPWPAVFQVIPIPIWVVVSSQFYCLCLNNLHKKWLSFFKIILNKRKKLSRYQISHTKAILSYKSQICKMWLYHNDQIQYLRFNLSMADFWSHSNSNLSCCIKSILLSRLK